jgi:3-oxoacyl-[acyl-carrier-protein] synthase III
MANLSFKNIGISGLAAAVPHNTIDNYNYTLHFSKEDVKEIVDKVGILERRFAPDDMCASDLCFAAAEQLINDMNINKEEIDLLVFVSQTPDYRMPATAITLQHRLGLGKHTAAFDLSLGCSAFIYGLSVVYGLMQSGGFRKALLLDGETRSRVYSPKDRKTAFLFGDGGVAAMIERDEKFGESFFSLHSDGSLADLIKMDAGGYRTPSSMESLTEKVVDDYGNIRTDEHGYMNGADVFNFVLKEIPNNIKDILAFSKREKEQIQYFIFHQANAYMNDYLAKKMKLDAAKVPQSLKYFGNTSSVSIPLTLCTQFESGKFPDATLLLSGFGVGMSWASAVFETKDLYNGGLIEV